MTIEKTPRFNARLWQRFISFASPYGRFSDRRPAGRLLFVLLIALLLGQAAFNGLFNRETGEFTFALINASDVLSGTLEVGLAVQAAGAFAAVLGAGW